ncbi:MAG: M48 family metallopeptidase [Candidatus Aenigmarchaeota archaeon]|nr:M48 family metallopeptidase [Candidatus Aenigmarchaeota archaeon]
MKKLNVQDQIVSNKLKSVVLIGLVFLSLIFLGYVIGLFYDPSVVYFFVIIAGVFSILFTFFSYYYSDKIVLASVKARPATKKEHRYLVNVVEELAIAAGIPTPKIYVIDSNEINAFATGRNPQHGVICVTTGMIKLLNRSELEGVVAHEMSHIGNYDIRFATLVAVMVGMVVIIADMFRRSMWYSGGSRDGERKGGSGVLVIVGLVFAILAPLLVKLVQLAISRKREYLADANGGYLTRYPEGLASALEKIKNHNTGRMNVSRAAAPLFIVNPFKGSKVSGLLSTHPDINERIKRLRSM